MPGGLTRGGSLVRPRMKRVDLVADPKNAGTELRFALPPDEDPFDAAYRVDHGGDLPRPSRKCSWMNRPGPTGKSRIGVGVVPADDFGSANLRVPSRR